MLPNLLTSYKAIRNKITWYWQKKRHTGTWNRIQSSEINLHKHSQLILDKVQSQFNEEMIVFSTLDARTFGCPYAKNK